MRTDESSNKLPLIIAGLGIAAAIGAGWYLQRKPAPIRPVAVPAATTPVAAPAPTQTAPQYPVAPLQQALTDQPDDPLPDLFSSDAFVGDALNALLANPMLAQWLVPEHRIARFVAFIDSLPNRKVGTNLWPLKPATGSFFAQDEQGQIAIGPANSARYDAQVQAFTVMDTGAAVALYTRMYPLLQQAYRELGYSDGYFNDRMIVVIDHLLAAPEPLGPVIIVRTDKGYAFADEALEAASSGEKMMMRIGLAHEASVKAKLRELRAALTKQP